MTLDIMAAMWVGGAVTAAIVIRAMDISSGQETEVEMLLATVAWPLLTVLGVIAAVVYGVDWILRRIFTPRVRPAKPDERAGYRDPAVRP